MTQRNIAIANFVPREVFNSSWPRFVGFQGKDKPEKPTGLFGLVDGATRMHAFFENTNINDVVSNKLFYSTRPDEIRGKADEIVYDEQGVGTVTLTSKARPRDMSIKWLDPYTYLTADGKVWDVYVVILGDDLNFKGTVDRQLKMNGYWDMGIWQPKEEQLFDDTYRIEQATINHVVKHGFNAMGSITMFDDNPNYGKYQVKEVARELPELN